MELVWRVMHHKVFFVILFGLVISLLSLSEHFYDFKTTYKYDIRNLSTTLTSDTKKTFVQNYLEYHEKGFVWETLKLVKTISKLPGNVKRKLQLVCKEKDTRLSEKPLQLTGLLSFPGSGNTWIRHLLQQLTGIATSSVYCDHNLEKRGFRHECTKQRNRTIVMKTHSADHIPNLDKVILIVRNPYEAFLAYMNYKSAGHTGVADYKRIQTKLTRIPQYQKQYTTLVQKVVEFTDIPVHVLQYEALKENMSKGLQALAKFLNVDANGDDIYCTEKLQEGLYHRKSRYAERLKTLQRIYTPDIMATMVSTVEHCQQLLEQRFHRNFNIGGPIQDVLMQSFTDVGRREFEVKLKSIPAKSGWVYPNKKESGTRSKNTVSDRTNVSYAYLQRSELLDKRIFTGNFTSEDIQIH